MDSKDPDLHVLDRWMLATKHTQHVPSTKTKCDYLCGWIKRTGTCAKISPGMVNPRDIFWLLACWRPSNMLVYFRDNCICCHTEIKVADQTFYLTQSQYIDIMPTSPSTDPTMPGTWQGNPWSANFEVTGMTRPRQIPTVKVGIKSQILCSQGRFLNH